MKRSLYNRPDFSIYLVHFTKDGKFCNKEQEDEILDFKEMSAKERFLSILSKKKIYSSVMPWTNTKGVCFTECPWSSLIAHSQCYSPYGIGFKKSVVFKKNGAPIFYLRSNLFERMKNIEKKTQLYKEILALISPFSPEYGTNYTKQFIREDGKRKTVDYSHEREWRCPKDFEFQYNEIEFLIIKSSSELQDIPQEVKESVGERIIIMDNYQLIEKLWPVHKIKD